MAAARCSPTGSVVEVVVTRDFFDIFRDKPITDGAKRLVTELAADFLIAERVGGDGFVGGGVNAFLLGDPSLISRGKSADFEGVFTAIHDDNNAASFAFNVFCLERFLAI